MKNIIFRFEFHDEENFIKMLLSMGVKQDEAESAQYVSLNISHFEVV